MSRPYVRRPDESLAHLVLGHGVHPPYPCGPLMLKVLHGQQHGGPHERDRTATHPGGAVPHVHREAEYLEVVRTYPLEGRAETVRKARA